MARSAAIIQASGYYLLPARPIGPWSIVAVCSQGFLLVSVVKDAWPETLGHLWGHPTGWPVNVRRLIQGLQSVQPSGMLSGGKRVEGSSAIPASSRRRRSWFSITCGHRARPRGSRPVALTRGDAMTARERYSCGSTSPGDACSTRVIENLLTICDEPLHNRYEL